ncbi:MAG: hypothetical protein EOP45_09570 [Sphingobacteriaceae bacterium]|nr:MAG: hypothetical protein EOP45_09570 [Sphingobacteriaceae bacterium]
MPTFSLSTNPLKAAIDGRLKQNDYNTYQRMIKRTAFSISLLLILAILFTFSTYIPWFVPCAALDRTLQPSIPMSIKKKCRFDPNDQMEGQKYWKSQKIIVCGMLRDGETALGYMKSQMMELVSYFEDYLILIVENDSIDSTRSQLLDWAGRDSRVRVLGCGGVNLESCILATERTHWHNQCPARISKMATLRNIYLDYIRENHFESEYNFSVVLDADLRGVLYKEGLLDTGNIFRQDEEKGEIDGISANGWFVVANNFFPCYMDSYAHEEIGVSTPYTHETVPPLFHFWNRRTLELISPCRRVVSAFGGMTFYRTSSLVTSAYSSGLNSSGRPICEHKFLHYNLKMWFNPKLLYLITSNPLL